MNIAFELGGGDAAASPDEGVDTGTIAWLLPEIGRAFESATTALRQFRAGAAGVERADIDLGPLRVARSHLHQAHGALELGEIAGVTKVTEAMESFLALFEEDPSRCDALALDAIVGGCRAIVEYLEDLQGGMSQQPLRLFASYRELLAVRGADRIHPADLFVADLAIRVPRGATSSRAKALTSASLADHRAHFEQALLRYIRNENDTKALATLARAVKAIEGSVAVTVGPTQGQQRAFWWVVRALFEALAHDGFAHATQHHGHIKRVAGRVNLQIRKLVDGAGAVAERLFADALFFVAIAKPVTPHVEAVQQQFRLAGTVPADFETQRYGRIDPATLKTARDALAAAKASWAAVVGGDIEQIREFARQTTALLDAVGPLKRNGLVQVAQVVDGIATELGFDPRQPAGSVGLDVATALLFLESAIERARLLDDAFDERAALVVARVEASATGQEHAVPAVEWLDGLSREAEERLTVASFVTELQANLRSAEKELDTYFRDPMQNAGLAEAQTALAQVSGALALLGHDDVHRAIDHARESIARFQQGSAVDQASFEALARNLGAVGFYVEQIKRDRIDADAFRFDAATGDFSADFGRRTVDADAPADVSPQTSDAFAPSDDALLATSVLGPDADEPVPYSTRLFAATQVVETGETLEEEIAHRAADAVTLVERLDQERGDRNVREYLAAAIDDVRRNAALIDDRPLQDEAATVLTAVRRTGHEPLGDAALHQLVSSVTALAAHANRAVGIAPPAVAPVEPTVAVPAADQHEEVDAELLEIFLEEAGGVLADAEASLRVLDADPHNATATVNLRRGFHTLKGSGRMVGLNAFGEAGWAVEETLNHHIADQVPASSDLRALIDYAIRYLSGWVADLRARGQSSCSPEALVEAARAVRTGASPAAALALPTTDATSAPTSASGAAPIAAPEEATAKRDDDFDTLLAPTAFPVEDPEFAATLLLRTEFEPGVEFFGEQPRHPVPGTSPRRPAANGDTAFALPLVPALDDLVAADAAAAEPVAAHDDMTTTSLFAADDMMATTLFAPDDMTSTSLFAADDMTATRLFAGDAAPVAHIGAAPAPARPTVPPEAVSEEITVTDVLGHSAAADFVDELAENFAEAHAEHLGEADLIDVSGRAPAGEPVAETVPTRADNVVAFTMRGQPAATDDIRQIGPVTLSVALFNIYLTEADELLRVLTQDFSEWRHELDRFVSEAALRAAHSLAGSSSTVGLVPAHDLAAGVEDVLVALYRQPVVLDAAKVDLLLDAVDALRTMLHRFAAERMPEPDTVRVARLIALRREITAHDSSIGDTVFLATDLAVDPEPAFAPLDFALDSRAFVDEAAATPTIGAPTAAPLGESIVDAGDASEDESVPASEAFDPITTVVAGGDAPAASAREAVVETAPVADAAVEEAPDPVAEIQLPADVVVDLPAIEAVAEAAFDEAVFEDSDGVAQGDAPPVAVEATDEHAEREPLDAPPPAAIEEPLAEEVAPLVDEPPAAELSAVGAEALLAARRSISERENRVRDDIDPDLLDVFVEEASEILPQVGGLLRTWQAHRANPAPARILLRHLHTLKGSARMAGAMRLGEVVHDTETRVEAASRLHEVPAALLDELLAAHDRSLELFDQLQQPASVEPAAVALQPTEAVVADSESAIGEVEAVPAEAPVVPVAGATQRDRVREGRHAGQQVVRVAAETLDRLVNLAGEVSISRARIENEVGQIKGAMADLSDNVERLRSQLREIELQAEFQMQSRMQSQQSGGEEREKFDPLEFDRFTRFQELTRMMAESVNDVKTVQQHLQKSLETAETDLTSQRRMTRDLQQDLMQVRMVPFSSIAERLYRVARRTAKEVDKRVNLDIRGGSVEIDRGVLERMAGPFEHLLRNHIVHGIESRDVRRQRGKSETGELLVEVRQEGNEIVLAFSDDGAGLDHEGIRAKGRELGLIGDEALGDAQVAELIFHPGITTVAEVTKLAGRGVGMDVVRSEALELAGRVAVDSTSGAGTRFTITLPLTLAVTQVVLVSVANRTYAMPAVLVEQVQQLRPKPLADAYHAGHLQWSGSPVRLAFLGTLLGIDDSVPVAQRSSPVLILRSAGDRMAVHVDEVIGNQEVVVKNLGPQLSRMTGVAGATVLGSGEIVLILNPVQLALAVRPAPRVAAPAAELPVDAHDDAHENANDAAKADAKVGEPTEVAPSELQTLPTVMVVDDSLTVRRVTQRLLSREGYQVVLAKDGVDALEQLQDFPPDVMLVDIEMPRMDGFDLTRNVRNDERYKHIPIVMITSRTAEKHRRHAAELGVDAYLGKPYQEDELLEILATHVKARRSQAA